jgi:hypothetical protein
MCHRAQVLLVSFYRGLLTTSFSKLKPQTSKNHLLFDIAGRWRAREPWCRRGGLGGQGRVSSVVSGRAADRGTCWRGQRCLAWASSHRGSWRSWSASRRSTEAAGARQPLRRPRCRRHRRHHRRPLPPAPNAAPLPRRAHAARRQGRGKEAARRPRPRPRKRGVGATALGI